MDASRKDATMLPHPSEKADPAPRNRLHWVIGAALVLGQLVAFWMVCSHQVRKAQMRDLTEEVQGVAISDCLQYIPRATLNSCANRVDPYRPGSNAAVPAGDKPPEAAPQAARARTSSTAPVNVSY
jgi:hypothetical protein